jgi:hypothetical protein
MDAEQRLLGLERRLKRTIVIAVVALVCAVPAGAVLGWTVLAGYAKEPPPHFVASYDENTISIAFRDQYAQPQIITHVFAVHGDQAVSARVDMPIAGESGQVDIPIRSLIWRDASGAPAKAPSSSDQLYFSYVWGEYGEDRRPWNEKTE